MTIKPLSTVGASNSLVSNRIHLPEGLIGIPEIKSMDVIFDSEELPLMRLCSAENKDYNFLVLDPMDVIPGYAIELPDADVQALGVKGASDVMLLNIVTVNCEKADPITVNLVGPIVINRRTGKARQVIIENYQEYSTYYPLINNNREVAVGH